MHSIKLQNTFVGRLRLHLYSFLVLSASLLSPAAFAQTHRLSGTVTSHNHTALVGATVGIKHSSAMTTTDTSGSFSVDVKKGDVLIVSFIGYVTQQIEITNQTSLALRLTESLVNLDDVVVTGYTSQRIRDITGSVAVVKTKDLVSIPAGQVEQMLQGRVAGLTVITSGMPGGPSNVFLHGMGNFGDVTPLYIIDGVQGNINNLNPDDIESMQALKDAGAASIYGVRGANGVLVITTKSGKKGRTRITYDFYAGITLPPQNNGKLNSEEMATLEGLASANAGLPFDNLYGTGAVPIVPDFFIAGQNVGLPADHPDVDPLNYNRDFTNGSINQIVAANKTGTNWMDEIFDPALTQNHSLRVSGANEKNKYLFSLGYLDQRGTLLYTYLKRFNIRVNTEFSPSDNIRIGENLQLVYRDNPIVIPDGLGDNEIASAMMSSPLLPVYDIDGGWAHYFPVNFYDNPVAYRANGKEDKYQSWEAFGNAYAEAEFLNNFTLRTNFGGNITNYNTTGYTYFSYYGRTDGLPDNAFRESSGRRHSWTWTNTLRYSQTFKDHSIKALLGTEAISNYFKEAGGRSAGFFNNDINYRQLGNGSAIGEQSNFSLANHSSLFSVFGKVDYGYKDKYFLSATLRRDGSSVFSSANRYGWFPSIGAAWRINEETFMNPLVWITELKLRASWGKTGFYGNTDPLNQYTLFGGSIANSYYDIRGTGNNPAPGIRNTRIGDPNTGWQEDIVTNIGIESIFCKGKLSMSLDWYHKKAKGLLIPILLPDVLGGATPPNINVGELVNKGLDLLLGSKGNWSGNWGWDATVTLSAYKNQIIKVNNYPFFIPQQTFSSATFSHSYIRNQVGQPISSFYGYKIIGIFKDASEVNNSPSQDGAAPGRFRYLDANNDKKIDTDDRIFLGHPNPDFTLGINLGIRFKNFDFSAFFYGSFGNEVINLPKYWSDVYQTNVPYVLFPVKSKEALYNSWTPQRTNSTLPIQEYSKNFSTINEHSYPMENGSYFRSKSLIIGYTIPNSLLKRLRIERIRVYAQAVNLFTLTKYSGLDPELSGQSAAFGIDYGNYPNQRQYLMGLNINF